jgi:hypothetical protein
MTDVD